MSRDIPNWHIDFTFKEDKNTLINKNTLMNLQLVNKFILVIALLS